MWTIDSGKIDWHWRHLCQCLSRHSHPCIFIFLTTQKHQCECLSLSIPAPPNVFDIHKSINQCELTCGGSSLSLHTIMFRCHGSMVMQKNIYLGHNSQSVNASLHIFFLTCRWHRFLKQIFLSNAWLSAACDTVQPNPHIQALIIQCVLVCMYTFVFFLSMADV